MQVDIRLNGSNKDGSKALCLPAQYQSSSGHYVGNYIVPKTDVVKELTETTKPNSVALQVIPRQCSNIFMCFLIHSTKGWIQSFMSTRPISGWFWPYYIKKSSILQKSSPDRERGWNSACAVGGRNI
jgi:hypothetical protein